MICEKVSKEMKLFEDGGKVFAPKVNLSELRGKKVLDINVSDDEYRDIFISCWDGTVYVFKNMAAREGRQVDVSHIPDKYYIAETIINEKMNYVKKTMKYDIDDDGRIIQRTYYSISREKNKGGLTICWEEYPTSCDCQSVEFCKVVVPLNCTKAI